MMILFSLFKKYNKNKFKIGFIDYSHVTIYNNYNLDYIVSLDKGFKVFEEIKLHGRGHAGQHDAAPVSGAVPDLHARPAPPAALAAYGLRLRARLRRSVLPLCARDAARQRTGHFPCPARDRGHRAAGRALRGGWP